MAEIKSSDEILPGIGGFGITLYNILMMQERNCIPLSDNIIYSTPHLANLSCKEFITALLVGRVLLMASGHFLWISVVLSINISDYYACKTDMHTDQDIFTLSQRLHFVVHILCIHFACFSNSLSILGLIQNFTWAHSFCRYLDVLRWTFLAFLTNIWAYVSTVSYK